MSIVSTIQTLHAGPNTKFQRLRPVANPFSQVRIIEPNTQSRIIKSNTQSRSMESNTHITLNDVDRRWKYRAGWPRLCHQRVRTSPSLSNISERDLQDLASRISTILDEHHITYRGRDFVTLAYRTQHRYLSNPPEDHFRVLVNCVFDPEQQKASPDAWAKAVVDIRHALRGIPNLCSMGIELYDRVYEQSLHLSDFPVHSEQTIEAWMSQYRPQILAKFESQPRLWQAMALMGLKASNERTEDHTCVLWFDAIDTDNALWRVLEAELVSMLPDNIFVEIWQARNKLLWDDDDLPSCNMVQSVQMEDFVFPPKPGSSLGVLNDGTSSATLGGYVRVHITDGSTPQDRIYGIANAHLLLDDATVGNLGLSQLASGIRLDTQEHRYQMQVPSQMDVDEFISENENNIRSFRKVKEETEQKKAFQTDDAEAIDRLDASLHSLDATINLFTQRVETARQNRRIGSATALAHGKCDYHHPGFKNSLAMDIALIDITELVPRPEDVKLQLYNSALTANYEIWQSWDVDGLSYTNGKPPIQIVAKCGRSTGYTKGLVHCIQVDLNIDNGLRKFSAWIVGALGPNKYAFSKPGDSGSFVFAQNQHTYLKYENTFRESTNDPGNLCVVGLQFGGSVDGRLAYFIPFDAVVEKIEALTGGKVTWPVKREIAAS